MAGSYDFFQMLQAVENYYGAGSDQWLAMATGAATAAEQAAILKQVPEVSTVISESGALRSWSLGIDESILSAAESSAVNAASTINSNTVAAGARTALMEIPGNAKIVGNTVEITSGATAVGAAGTGTATLECVLGHAATALLGAGIGMKLGVWIDGALYNANPEFWDSHNLETMNPETWRQHWATNWILEHSGYPVTEVLADKNGQFYCDEELFALYAQYMADQGFFGTPYWNSDRGDIVDAKFYYPAYIDTLGSVSYITGDFETLYEGNRVELHVTGDNTVYTYSFVKPNLTPTADGVVCISASDAPFSINGSAASTFTCKDGTVVYIKISLGPVNIEGHYEVPAVNVVPTSGYLVNDFIYKDVPYLILYGHHNAPTQREGVNTYDDMPVIDPSWTTDQVLDYLKQNFPDLFTDRARVGTLNDDGTVTDRYYIPFNIPSGGTDTQPETRPTDYPKLNPTDDPTVDPETNPQTKTANEAVKTPSDPTKPEVPNTGEGSTPTYTPPTGTADALYSIYNPTVAQVQSLGAWLWSTNFVDQLLKMFNNPMDAIISLHKIYGTPHTGGSQNIKVGYLDSGVSSKVVDQQYITIDCGSVNLYERFANVFDYAPYTQIDLYLPFVGIVSVDVADVMRGRVNVIYHIDVITGAVLVEIKILRDGTAGGVIYQYTGSCAEHYPLSSGSYMGIVTGAAGIAGGIAATIATGGAAAPMLLGAAAGIGGMHAQIQKTNGFSANAGAMGLKKPYFIISRPQTAMAQGYEKYMGRGANTLVNLSNMKGFVKVKEIYFTNSNPGMTDNEQNKLRAILKEGVYV